MHAAQSGTRKTGARIEGREKLRLPVGRQRTFNLIGLKSGGCPTTRKPLRRPCVIATQLSHEGGKLQSGVNMSAAPIGVGWYGLRARLLLRRILLLYHPAFATPAQIERYAEESTKTA